MKNNYKFIQKAKVVFLLKLLAVILSAQASDDTPFDIRRNFGNENLQPLETYENDNFLTVNSLEFETPMNRYYCYSYYGAYGETFLIGLAEIGDTLIQDKNCVIIEEALQHDLRYIWYNGQQIYWYSKEDEAFYLLYDFDLDIGDVLTIDLGFRPDWLFTQQECASFLITGTDYEIINGELLKVQYIESLEASPCYYPMQWGNKLIERIGSTEYFLPYFSGDEIWANLKEAVFNDSTVYETNNCIVESTSEKLKTIPKFEAIPNPFLNELAFAFQEDLVKVGTAYQLRIYDIHGRLVQSQAYQTGMRVNASNLSQGVYTAILSEDGMPVGLSRLVKQ